MELPHPLQVDLSPAPPPVRRPKPLNPPFWVLTEASLQKQDCLNFQFLSLPGRWGGAVVPPLLSAGSPGNQPLPLGAFHRLRCGSQELVRNIKMPLWLLSLSKCQGPKQDYDQTYTYYNAEGHDWGLCFSLPTVLCIQLVPNKYLPARTRWGLRLWERTKLTLSSTGTPSRPALCKHTREAWGSQPRNPAVRW